MSDQIGGQGPKTRISRADFRAIDRLVRSLPAPAKGNERFTEAKLRPLGLTVPWISGLVVVVTAAGARAWALRYRADGVERLYTIGDVEAWPAEALWPEAAERRRDIDAGKDPRAARKAQHEAPTMATLATRFEAEHLVKRRASTTRDYKALLRRFILPELGNRKVAAIKRGDIEKLHAKIAATAPYLANRTVALLSSMFTRAIAWEMRPDNPAKGIEREPEEKRNRYLTGAEITRLTEALASHPEKASANAVRLLLLTGARRGEVLSATWNQFDLGAGVWTKPSALTKQKREHRLPLSAPALTLLSEMKAEVDQRNERRAASGTAPLRFLFPGKTDDQPQADLKHFWAAICRKADLRGVRVHDLRHTHASILASAGLSLPVIGALLGHTQAATTHRYAHLMDDPLRAAAERAGAIIAGTDKPGAEVVPLERGRRA